MQVHPLHHQPDVCPVVNLLLHGLQRDCRQIMQVLNAVPLQHGLFDGRLYGPLVRRIRQSVLLAGLLIL